MTQSEFRGKLEEARLLLPGAALSAVLALAASHVSASLGGPKLLFALLFGMAFNFLADSPQIRPGLDVVCRSVLRLGVALLGARITFEQAGALGLETLGVVLGGVALTLIVGSWIGRRMDLGSVQAILSAGAVAICGASAAMAIASVLPKNKDLEKQTILTVVGVTSLSTIAMIFYPSLTQLLGMDVQAAGIFLGATIHDVAQVVGAGLLLSDDAAQTATIVKLVRVMCLLPVVLCIALIFRSQQRAGDTSTQRPPFIPLFMLGFIGLAALNSFALTPPQVSSWLSQVSSGCILTSVAAMGVRTNLQQLFDLGSRPVVALVLQTVLLAVYTAAALIFLL